MARLYVFAEGPTEQVFAATLLAPHLAQIGVYLQAAILIAHSRRHGVVHRGGGRKYVPMKNDILRFLAQERAADAFFTTMIDLYAISQQFPGLEKSLELRHLPHKRVQFLERPCHSVQAPPCWREPRVLEFPFWMIIPVTRLLSLPARQ